MAEDTARALTVKQVQDRLQLSKRTVLRLIERGELRAIRVGRVWRIPADGLNEYLARANNVPKEGEKAGMAPAFV